MQDVLQLCARRSFLRMHDYVAYRHLKNAGLTVLRCGVWVVLSPNL
jgi:hypothetical protein